MDDLSRSTRHDASRTRSASSERPALTDDIAKHIRRIQFQTQKQVADVMAGAYLSVFKGQGMEFDEVRPYTPGDDVRTIDWNVTARTGEPHVKRFVEERELTVMLIVDVSSSMEFGARSRSKREAAAELAALVALSAAANDDKIGLLTFADGSVDFIPPRKGTKHAMRLVRTVFGTGTNPANAAIRKPSAHYSLWKRFIHIWRRRELIPPGGMRGTRLKEALDHCGRVLRRRTVIFVISDFAADEYLDALTRLRAKHDVIAARVFDPVEESLPAAGLVVMHHPETGEATLVDSDSDSVRSAFQDSATSHVKIIADNFKQKGIDAMHVNTSVPVSVPLLALMQERKAKVRR